MSSHFNYEIEERNMRNQLKAIEVPFKEDAWHSYEDYAKQFQSSHKTQIIPNFNFALNRTVILPVVFGAIIVLFSFLLFNFINIKNTKPAAANVLEVKPTLVTSKVEPQKIEPKKEIIAAVKKDTVKIEAQITATVTSAPITNSVAVLAKTTPSVTTAISPNPAPEINPSQNSHLARSIPSQTSEPKKKRRKKNSAEVLESIATPVSLPTLTQEEVEPELK